jgi:hypothetical protein
MSSAPPPPPRVLQIQEERVGQDGSASFTVLGSHLGIKLNINCTFILLRLFTEDRISCFGYVWLIKSDVEMYPLHIVVIIFFFVSDYVT